MTDTHSNNTNELQDQDPGFFEGLGISMGTSFIEDELKEKGISIEFNKVGIAKDALYDAYTLVRDNVIDTDSMAKYTIDIAGYVAHVKNFEKSENEITAEEQQQLDEKLESIESQHPELSELYEITPIESVQSQSGQVFDITARIGARLDDSESFIMRLNVDFETRPPHIAINFQEDGKFERLNIEEKLEYIQENFSDDLSFIQAASAGANGHFPADAQKAFQGVLDNANKKIGGEPASPVMIREAAREKLEEQTTITSENLTTNQVDNIQTNAL